MAVAVFEGWEVVMLQALRIRDFRLLWGGGFVSALGSWLLTLAIPAHIFLVTSSLRATGLTVVFLAANASLSAVLIPFGVQRLGGSEHTGFLLACLGAGFLAGAPAIRPLLDRAQPRILLAASLAACAAAYFLLFTSYSLTTALPAAAAVGMSGSIALVIPQTAMQRVIPNAALGRVSAVFLTGEAAATVAGSVAGPFLAQAAHLTGVAAVAGLVTLGAAALARLIVPPLAATPPPVGPSAPTGPSARRHPILGTRAGSGRAGRGRR